jgi:hypothetical protein
MTNSLSHDIELKTFYHTGSTATATDSANCVIGIPVTSATSGKTDAFKYFGPSELNVLRATLQSQLAGYECLFPRRPIVQNARLGYGVLFMTQTEQAKAEFLQEVQSIEGASVQVRGRGSLMERTIRVVVPDIRGTVADRVYDLETSIHRQYGSVNLGIRITEAQHDDTKMARALNVE